MKNEFTNCSCRETTADNADRQYGIDLLRIISMLFVMLLHTLGHGGILKSVSTLSPNYIVAWSLETIAYCAVNCFVLITGYIGARRKPRYSNLINLWFQVLFYSACISGLFFVRKHIAVTAVIKSFFPVTTSQYWFFTAYFGMMLLSPLFNCLIESIKSKELLIKYSIALFCFTILPCINGALFGLNGGYSAFWFCVLYITGGIIRHFRLFSDIESKVLIGSIIGLTCITIISHMVIAQITTNWFGEEKYSGVLIRYTSPTIFLISVLFLELFSRIDVKKLKKIVSFIAPLSFGAYLIQDNNYVREFIIKNRFANLASCNPLVLLGGALGIAVITFAICIMIDYLRLSLFNFLKVKRRLCLLESNIESKLFSFSGMHI